MLGYYKNGKLTSIAISGGSLEVWQGTKAEYDAIEDKSILNGKLIDITDDESCEITVDDELSDTSENPVQNKVVTIKINEITNNTLYEDLTIYVATTGSDETGDGTESNPYATVQYAVDIVPKNLNNYKAVIIIDDGTYSEDIVVEGFGNSSQGLTIQEKNFKESTSEYPVELKSLKLNNNDTKIYIHRLNFPYGIEATYCDYVFLDKCRAGYTIPETGLYQTVYGMKFVFCPYTILRACVSSFGWEDTSSTSRVTAYGYYVEHGIAILQSAICCADTLFYAGFLGVIYLYSSTGTINKGSRTLISEGYIYE